MWPHRLKLGVALTSLVFVVTCSAPVHHAQQSPRSRVAVLHRAALRPVVIGRATWHADERDVHGKPIYDDSIKAVFVHHTDNPNDYDCTKDVPAMLQAIEERHIHDMGWDDVGYNFVVDRCGTIYEGRAGSVDRDVRGAHTEGFNAHTVGIAALGSFGAGVKVPRPMLEAIAAIAAWKLDPGIDPRGKVRLVSSNGESRYRKGTTAELDAISGHRDVYETDCPGAALYADLPWIRQTAARLRQKATWVG
ncbi:N-acetylmuramoyl-L-alanine amidase [Streptomyces sp. DvalAA-14]|uniref:N-acetylmuramoyl-L-alanine amidase n=1 Tax=unclassified Streptomyces TaxID=2593676 RepID=UPI00081B6B2D|nr:MULTISPECIES: N-acetylmuramoyl-L-alanine amidase [unclassified Streptomyces]MYS22741.1 N-acetylmuramoyl-L-alanine amidase [Streptomyces sp. SID4948]SCE21682.1 N-acetylmuramoyl-L-alanine amidase [Streptomyces sp. DvalAA-14]